ncbi:alcohol dehydrogenase catalytic domain-containing protein [Alcaligenaceae bacterium]|nr:alcohol dehydrogenase catalytic domain-containing protein [Alcaligenaceae bacterium]
MLAVRKLGPHPGISLDIVSEPSDLNPDEVLIEVAAAGICGSDVHVYEWTEGYEFMRSRLPITLGHEFSGHIVKTGSHVTGLAEGDLVSAMPTSSCMRCAQCAGGEPHLCLHRRTVGLTQDGAFSRLVKVPSISCVPFAHDVDPVLAALIEPLSVGDNATNLGEVAAGDTVVVLGPGTIGQAAAWSARWKGAACVIVVGMNDSIRLRTVEAMGATHTIDLAETSSFKERVLTINGGRPVDVVIEATGRGSSVTDGLSVLKRGGIFVSAGIHGAPVTFDLTSLVRNKQQIRGAHGSQRRSWERIARRIAQNPESVRPMVSLELPLSDAKDGFERCLAREVSKVILRPSS